SAYDGCITAPLPAAGAAADTLSHPSATAWHGPRRSAAVPDGKRKTGHRRLPVPGLTETRVYLFATKTCEAISESSSAASPLLPTSTPPGDCVTLTTEP